MNDPIETNDLADLIIFLIYVVKLETPDAWMICGMLLDQDYETQEADYQEAIKSLVEHGRAVLDWNYKRKRVRLKDHVTMCERN